MKLGTKFPDYVHKDGSLIIELFGEYWHLKKEVKPRIAYFKAYGFKCLIIWASELTSPSAIRDKAAKFVERGV